jgi:heterodisulfide reductase subunit D
MIYFRGCVVREKLSNIADATEEILKHAGVDYSIIDDEGCCGSFLLRTGYREDALEVMNETLKMLQDHDLKDETILVSCAGCYNTLKNDYKDEFDVKLNVVHTSELIKRLINEDKLKVKKSNLKATYHDPCHLGRHSNIYEEPRQVVSKTCNLVEMNHNREHSRCCGAGAGVKSAFPDTALEVASRRIKDADDTGAEILVTSCSFCILNLENALENKQNISKKSAQNSSVSRVLDISELILMGLEHEEV